MLYLHTDYALLRKSFRNVTSELIETSRTAGVLLNQKVEITTPWTITFTIIAMFDSKACHNLGCTAI
jgi:hypothetical protein